MTEIVELDSFDRRLIDEVRLDNLQPARELAAKVGLSESAVLRRLRRLRAEKVIVADIAVVDPRRLAPAITIHVLVEFERHNLKAEQAFAEKLSRHREVVGAWNVTGRTDFLVTCSVPSLVAFQQFADAVLAADENIRSFETLVSLREIVRFDPMRGGEAV
ncbi:MAG: Lrp/AsnC family transcriptional regulator [Caulobacterales bacterium]|nr:Lrp/AsnC family transcriptional regulator [Caulobacterales bacterium]